MRICPLTPLLPLYRASSDQFAPSSAYGDPDGHGHFHRAVYKNRPPNGSEETSGSLPRTRTYIQRALGPPIDVGKDSLPSLALSCILAIHTPGLDFPRLPFPSAFARRTIYIYPQGSLGLSLFLSLLCVSVGKQNTPPLETNGFSITHGRPPNPFPESATDRVLSRATRRQKCPILIYLPRRWSPMDAEYLRTT